MLIYMSIIELNEDKDLFEGLYLKYRKDSFSEKYFPWNV